MGGKILNGCVSIDDTDMYYASFGSGSRVLTVLPGLSDGLSTVKGKAMLLAPSYRKFFADYTVYMFSRKNRMPEGYTIREMARDQVRALKALGISRTSVLGVSQGGMIAQYIAIDCPEIMDKLILAVTAPYANPTAENAVKGWIEMAERGDHRSLMLDTADKMYSRKYLTKNRRIFPLMAMFTKPSSYERFFRNAYAILGFDARDKLADIKCPTLIIAGDDDKTVGNEAPYELNKAIPGSRLFIYKGLGHAAYEEARGFYDRVLEFCNS